MRLRTILFFVAALTAAGPAMAELTKEFTLTAGIANGCAIGTVRTGHYGDIDLGTLSGVTGGTAEAELISSGGTGLLLDCTPGMSVTVAAGAGGQPNGSVRQLVSDIDTQKRLPYQLFANGSSVPWTSDAIPLSFPVGTSRQRLPIRARAMLTGPIAGGRYTDLVQVTVAW